MVVSAVVRKQYIFVQCNKLHGEENYVSHWKAEKYRDKRENVEYYFKGSLDWLASFVP